ncbi:MAG: response regulator [Burkholderiaceae bacterium]|nr:response regulator [Microbacteriaceae bacterium]
MIRVLVVEDDPTTAQAHAQYLGRLPGFALAGIATTGSAALRLISESTREGADGIDLVLLDMHLPDMDGLEVCRSIRSARLTIDVIAITAVRDLPVVREAISVGIVQYLIKPFGYPAFVEKLESFASYHGRLTDPATPTTQAAVDSALASLRSTAPGQLPKGLAADTLGAVTALLARADVAWSATELSDHLGLSRVTARRYLEHLAGIGQAARESRHGGSGRPEIEYRWRR